MSFIQESHPGIGSHLPSLPPYKANHAPPSLSFFFLCHNRTGVCLLSAQHVLSSRHAAQSLAGHNNRDRAVSTAGEGRESGEQLG